MLHAPGGETICLILLLTLKTYHGVLLSCIGLYQLAWVVKASWRTVVWRRVSSARYVVSKSFLYLGYTSSLMAKGIDTKASRKVRRNYMRGSPGSGLWGCYLRSNWFLPIFSCPLFLRRCSNPIVSVYPLWCLLPCLLNSLKVNGPRGRIWWMGDKECKRVEVSVLGGLLWCKGPGGKRCFQLEFHWTGLW